MKKLTREKKACIMRRFAKAKQRTRHTQAEIVLLTGVSYSVITNALRAGRGNDNDYVPNEKSARELDAYNKTFAQKRRHTPGPESVGDTSKQLELPLATTALPVETIRGEDRRVEQVPFLQDDRRVYGSDRREVVETHDDKLTYPNGVEGEELTVCANCVLLKAACDTLTATVDDQMAFIDKQEVAAGVQSEKIAQLMKSRPDHMLQLAYDGTVEELKQARATIKTLGKIMRGDL